MYIFFRFFFLSKCPKSPTCHPDGLPRRVADAASVLLARAQLVLRGVGEVSQVLHRPGDVHAACQPHRLALGAI